MLLCDITFSYTETSGGIRTYLDEKRRYILDETPHEHLLIIPGEKDAVEEKNGAATCRIASPILPGCAPYRIFARPDKINRILHERHPDVIELGSAYISPWPAFHYRDEMREIGGNCLIAGYFHTDFPEAYVGGPLRRVLGGSLTSWSETLETLGLKLAETAAAGAAKYLTAVFDRCDIILAATPGQARKLREYGAPDPQIIPLGVALDCFYPNKRQLQIRKKLGAESEEVPVLIYAGRLDVEKRIKILLKSFQLLPEELKAHLVLIGNGPLREELLEKEKETERVHILPFEPDKERLAALLASADVYVSAGPNETFALSVIEAQACGLPVAGVDAGALRERVPEGLGYLGPVDDARALSANIQRAWENRKSLGANAREHVEKHFSWKSTFTKLMRLYEESAD